jgi:hypothetical protein
MDFARSERTRQLRRRKAEQRLIDELLYARAGGLYRIDSEEP